MSDNLPAPSVATQVRQANSDINGKCLICDAEPDWQCDEVVHHRDGRLTYGRAVLPVRGWRQPKPAASTGPDVLGLVVKDLADRAALGLKKYGQPLRPNNGRDALLDAYHEALDIAMYLRQCIEERNVLGPATDKTRNEDEPFIGLDGKRTRNLTGDSW